MVNKKVKPKHPWAQEAQGLERGVPGLNQRRIPPAKPNKWVLEAVSAPPHRREAGSPPL